MQVADRPPQSPPLAPPTWVPPNPPPHPPHPSQTPTGERGWRALIAVCVVLGLLGAGVMVGRLTVASGSGDTITALPSETIPEDLPTDPPVTGDSVEPVVAVAEAVTPAVVKIRTGFGEGCGVVYDPDGLVLTNAHVVGGESRVQVTLADGATVEGEVLGTDPPVDIAVVSIDPDAVLEVATLALGEEVKVGQLAVAVGSPFALDQTVTAGIVSAVDRPFPTVEELTVGMIQTDAPINPGNSGGALADREGKVIGIPTAIVANAGDSAGIGFAIPIDFAYERATKIVNGEPLDLPFLGVRRSRSETSEPGALIGGVEPGSAADEAGLRAGDVVHAIDGQTVRSFDELAAEIAEREPGDSIELDVERGGETLTLEATLGVR